MLSLIFLLAALVLTVITENLAVPLVMAILYVLILMVVSVLRGGSSSGGNSGPPPRSAPRCPHCGGSVTIRGQRWECGWCGDCGDLSSLR